ncbi:MAG: hypothetical protein ACUVX8_08105 [Candidatus Zipacnadales bacterium]
MSIRTLVIIVSGFWGWSAVADELTVGPWTITYSQQGVTSANYDGTPVLGFLSATLYTPDYQSSHWSLAGANWQREYAGSGSRLVLTHDLPGKANGKGTLEVTGNTLRWTVDVQMLAEGPLEVHVAVPKKAVETAWGDLFFAIDGRPTEIICGHFFSPLYPQHEVRLESEKFDITLTRVGGEGRWVFQDRRNHPTNDLRMIGLSRSTGERITKVTFGIEIAVDPLAPEVLHARRLVRHQRRVTISELPVQNPGFEGADFAAWSHGPNAEIVGQNPAEGGRCARLIVNSLDDPVYITQQVPVTPGTLYQLSCKLRTEDVRSVEGMPMTSVGACLIHEWADAEGKWLCAGAYSDSVWGTTDWQTVQCEELVAPDEVGYAIVFLALRGFGTAWFDEVKLREIKRHPILQSPLDGATLANNRPLFQWRADPTAVEYHIKCQGPSGGFETTTSEPEYRPVKPLPPGKYEWQVTAGRGAPSVSWTFTQTAPENADTTGPEITINPQSFVNSSSEFVISVHDPSGVELRALRLVVKEAEIPVRSRREGDLVFVRPRRGWPRGGYRVEVSLCDSFENWASASTWVVNTLPPPKTFEWTYDQGIWDGKTCFLPLAMYQVPPDQMSRVKEAGFNTVHLYTWEGSQDDVKAREYLNACRENGLFAFVGFDRGNSSGSGLVQMNLDHVAARIGALRDHPALLAWYLFDEPDLTQQYVSPPNLQKLYQFIKALDPYHPVIVTFAMDNSLAQYPPAYDVHWTQVYGSTEQVRSRLLKHRAVLGPERKIMAILTCSDSAQSAALRAGQQVEDRAFVPTPEKMRADIAMALALHSSGLAWWWYGDGRQHFLTAADVPAAWQALTKAVAEVHTIEPLLTAEGEELPTELATEPETARVVARCRRVGERAIIIVASAEEERVVRYELTSRRLPLLTSAKVLFEDRTVAIMDGTLTDSIEPVGRHIYEVTW